MFVQRDSQPTACDERISYLFLLVMRVARALHRALDTSSCWHIDQFITRTRHHCTALPTLLSCRLCTHASTKQRQFVNATVGGTGSLLTKVFTIRSIPFLHMHVYNTMLWIQLRIVSRSNVSSANLIRMHAQLLTRTG